MEHCPGTLCIIVQTYSLVLNAQGTPRPRVTTVKPEYKNRCDKTDIVYKHKNYEYMNSGMLYKYIYMYILYIEM